MRQPFFDIVYSLIIKRAGSRLYSRLKRWAELALAEPNAFTVERLYSRTPLQSNAFTVERLYSRTSLQSNVFAVERLYSRTSLQPNIFTVERFCTRTPYTWTSLQFDVL